MKARPARQLRCTSYRLRRLRIESLEDRRLLAGSPWQNPAFRLDVSHNGFTTPGDALAIINRIHMEGIGPLPDPGPGGPEFFYDTNGDNRLTASDLLQVINGMLAPPSVGLTSLTPYTIDVTPQVTVTATPNSQAALPDGTAVHLDVDLNNDGDFSDDGEFDHTQSTVFEGSSTFEITPALARSDEQYLVRMRAWAQDVDGVMGTSAVLPLDVDTLTSTALEDYVNTPDASYHYTLANTVDGDGYTFYALDMTSQTWRSAADVDKPDWRHWVEVIVPDGAIGNTALLYVTGGNNNFGSPPSTPDAAMLLLAQATGTVTVRLRTVPSEPLIFTDETAGRSEDEIIAYTFDKFLENVGEPGNETWPLLIAMAKSAVRAMDTVSDFIPQVRPGAAIDEFVVTGYSKRGWTTWLTAAADDRVRAIIPGVIDVLNIAPQMVHHYGVYGFFSEAIHDYQDLQIFDRMLTDEMRELSRIVDPYRYLTNGRFDDLPKLILNSAGDEFFATDSSQFYIHDLPGAQNYMRYIPNTGHGLDIRAVESSLSFYDAVLNERPLPEYLWTVEQDGSIHVHADTAPSVVKLWQATNPAARDFRRTWNPTIDWTSTVLAGDGSGNYVGDVNMPAAGATAYLVELTFANPVPGLPAHVFTTEARVKSLLPFHPWPFETGSAAPSFALEGPTGAFQAADVELSIDSLALAAVATALAMQGDSTAPVAEAFAGLLAPAVEERQSRTISAAIEGLLLSDAEQADEALDAETDAELVDYVFAATLAEILD